MDREHHSDKSITVIGGGPAGMAAAISAAREGAAVSLIEKNNILGRKLLATGNGRCNLTNRNCADAEETLRFFAELGLLTRTESEGRVYPYAEQAAAVQETLIAELNALGVTILCGQEVRSIQLDPEAFLVITNSGTYPSDAVIVATGGKAGPQYGATGDGYRFAKAFGHHVVRLMPSLVQMVSDQTFIKELKGVRTKGQVTLLRNYEAVDQEIGEIQFTEDGLSGICIFNLSKEYIPGDIIRIDLFPEYKIDELEALLLERTGLLGDRELSVFFNGMLHKKLSPVLIGLLQLDVRRSVSGLSREEIREMARRLKEWDITVTGTKGWKEAQVTAGGVDLAEVNLKTMESNLVRDLFFAGELLDVDEKCGGYNLQWAWTSGLTAGKAAAGARRNHAENT